MREYPHQMSGGMRQRIVGAIALAGGPRLVIADEPTTNLDVTIQAQYLDLLKDIQRETGVALIFVTHNLGIVAKMCDRVAVMYAGRIVEQAPVRELFDAPQAPVHARRCSARCRSSAARSRSTRSRASRPNLASLPAGLRLPSALPRGDAALRDARSRGDVPCGSAMERRPVLAPRSSAKQRRYHDRARA